MLGLFQSANVGQDRLSVSSIIIISGHKYHSAHVCAAAAAPGTFLTVFSALCCLLLKEKITDLRVSGANFIGHQCPQVSLIDVHKFARNNPIIRQTGSRDWRRLRTRQQPVFKPGLRLKRALYRSSRVYPQVNFDNSLIVRMSMRRVAVAPGYWAATKPYQINNCPWDRKNLWAETEDFFCFFKAT